MTEETELLKKINRTLDDLKAITVLVNQDKIADEKEKLLKEGSVKLQIYNLIDGEKGLADVAQAIGKNNNYVSSYISILQREGLIRTIEKQGKQVYEQTF